MSASPAHCCPKTSTPRLFFSRSPALPGGSHSTESAELLTEDSSSDQASHPAARSVEDIWIRVVLVKELGVDGVLIDKFHVTISLGSPDSLVFASAFCIDGVRLAVEFCLMICLTEMLFDGMSCALSFSVELGLGVGSCEVFKSILWMFRFLLGYLKTSDGIADLCFVFVPSAVPIDCCSIPQTEVVLGMDNVD
ncbi:hypothetical protein ZIOFF_062688 [Zingiber officinale]|uniref:Uncharacterized protein n=1 Tax=Zingiber officinale TaxID=94328 RepID=A0A8J5F1E9_ZINOF|nr:hypothetical protein ZIOFF_062688 [Zingiber officinale]